MGIYYHGISKRMIEADGRKVALAVFWGKAPFTYYGTYPGQGRLEGRWNSFLTRSSNTAAHHRHFHPDLKLVLYKNPGHGAPVYYWTGAATWADDYIDTFGLGRLIDTGKRGNARWKLDIDHEKFAKFENKFATA